MLIRPSPRRTQPDFPAGSIEATLSTLGATAPAKAWRRAKSPRQAGQAPRASANGGRGRHKDTLGRAIAHPGGEKRADVAQTQLRDAAPKRKESDILRAVLDYLATADVVAWRNQSGMIFGEHKGKRWAVRMGMKGVSDIVGFRKSDGKIVCVECKRPGQRLTDAQQRFLRSVHQAGGVAIWATSVEDVRAALGR